MQKRQRIQIKEKQLNDIASVNIHEGITVQ